MLLIRHHTDKLKKAVQRYTFFVILTNILDKNYNLLLVFLHI